MISGWILRNTTAFLVRRNRNVTRVTKCSVIMTFFHKSLEYVDNPTASSSTDAQDMRADREMRDRDCDW